MADEKSLRQAKVVFSALCEMLDEKNWRYQKDEQELAIVCGAQGDDLPMEIRIEVDPDRLLVMLMSKMPFVVPEERRTALAIAVSKANYGMVDGSFDFNYLNGSIIFRLTSCYRDSLISKELLEYMLMCACFTIDKYNDKFLIVAKNDMTNDEVAKFID